MRLPPSRLLLLSTLSAGLVLGTGCKRSQGASDTSPGTNTATDAPTGHSRKKRKELGLPRPLRLPASSPIIVHIEQPEQVVGGLRAYAPQLPASRDLLQQVLGRSATAGDFERKLANFVDLQRSWDAASVDGQLIVHLPILPARVASVQALLANKPPVGKFGAVDMQRGDVPGPKLAWVDPQDKAITFADTERGLVTGAGLAKAYGRQPVRLRLEGTEARKYAPQFALSQLQAEGAGAHDLSVVLESVPPELLSRLDKLEAGALTGLLESPMIAVGASSRYTDYQADVRKVLTDAKRTVDRQNFLVKGNLENLRARFATFARSWNGRTMVGVGPANHVLIGLGADDPKHMGGALYHFITGLTDNIGMARSFGVDVPKLRFKRNALRVADQNVAVLVLPSARKFLPRELHPMVNDRGELRVTMAFPSRAGAGMIVIGPASESTITRWLKDTAKARSGTESAEDYISAVVAVDPEKLAPLGQRDADPSVLLSLSADREPTMITSTRDGNNLTVRVKGPKIETRPKRLGGRMGQRDRTNTPPANGRPAKRN